jgi:hypothetical protein
MTPAQAPTGQDAAWVVLETPLASGRLAAFVNDVQRLYRLNPFLEFTRWDQGGPAHWRAEVLNHSNGQRTVLEATVTRGSEQVLQVDYASGLKKCTRFEIEATPSGSRLTITEEYRAGDSVNPEAEVDRSLHAWGVALKGYLDRDRRWGRLPLYRWFMERVWLPMKPAARRITFLVLVIGVADIGLVVLGLAIYWIESGR